MHGGTYIKNNYMPDRCLKTIAASQCQRSTDGLKAAQGLYETSYKIFG